METRAIARTIHISPKKVRLVADVIRGLDVAAAQLQLAQIQRAPAEPLAKLLSSAVSNARENHQLDPNNLFVKEILVDADMTLHRWMPRAMGRATPIRKRMSQIKLVLAERVPTDGKKKAAKTKEKTTDDLVTVSSIDELKAIEKQSVPDEKVDVTERPVEPQARKATGKGFAKKVFNRKSG